MEGVGGFKLNNLPVDYMMAYWVIMSRIHLIKSKDPIIYDRVLCLYAQLTHVPIDFSTVTVTLMKLIPFSGKTVPFPFESLITQIAEHFEISTMLEGAGAITILLDK